MTVEVGWRAGVLRLVCVCILTCYFGPVEYFLDKSDPRTFLRNECGSEEADGRCGGRRRQQSESGVNIATLPGRLEPRQCGVVVRNVARVAVLQHRVRVRECLLVTFCPHPATISHITSHHDMPALPPLFTSVGLGTILDPLLDIVQAYYF